VGAGGAGVGSDAGGFNVWSLINGAADLVARYPEYAVLLAFAASIIEAVAVLGILVPGTPILMAVAAAAAMAGLPMTPILVVSVIGAVIGDFVSFYVGRRFSFRLRGVWPFATRPALLGQAERFFTRYGTVSVATCRFVPVLRSTVPLVAGMAGMSRPRFLIANISSALVWAPVHVVPAQFAGLSLVDLEGGDWQSTAICGAVLAVFSLGGWLVHRRLARAR
jgi:membrane protein DedA with SNARE-associated domain